jgi:hypothetical protein
LNKKSEQNTTSSLKSTHYEIPAGVYQSMRNRVCFCITIIFGSQKKITLDPKNDDLDSVLTNYVKRGLKSVWAKKEDVDAFLNLSKTSKALQIDPRGESETQILAKLCERVTQMREGMQNLGANLFVLDLAVEISAKSVFLMQKRPHLLKSFIKNGVRFPFCQQRSIDISFTACSLLQQFKWASEVQYQKITLASLLCDVTQTESEIKEVDTLKLDPNAKWQKFLNIHIKSHPIEVARELSKYSDIIYPDTLKVIEQHHELPNGKGFPKGIDDQRISFLSSIYIISEHLVDHLRFQNYDFNKVDDICNRLKKNFSSSNFSKALSGLESLFPSLNLAN